MVSHESLLATGVTDGGVNAYFYTRVTLPAKSDMRAAATAAMMMLRSKMKFLFRFVTKGMGATIVSIAGSLFPQKGRR